MYFRRKAYDKLIEWKENYANEYATLLEGARREYFYYCNNYSSCSGGDLYMPGGQHDYLAVKEALEKGVVTKKQLQINATRVMRMARSLVERVNYKGLLK